MRYRHKLSQLRTGLKSQVHSVLGKEGVVASLTTLWGPGGARFLEETPLGEAYAYRVESLRDLIGRYDREVTELDGRIHLLLLDDVGYRRSSSCRGWGECSLECS